MTEYGRSPGSEPWHPEDPAAPSAHGQQGHGGDHGWAGHQAPPGHEQGYGTQQYGDDQYQQHHQHGNDQHQQYGQYQQQHSYQPQQPYGGYQEQPYQQHTDQQVYGTGSHPYVDRQYPAQGYGGQDYGGQGYAGQQQPQYQYGAGSWDTAQQAAMPYEPVAAAPFGDERPDLYGTPDAYPPPRPPGRRGASVADPEPASGEWEEQQEEETHPFFTGEDSDEGDGDEPDASRRGSGGDRDTGGRNGRGTKKQKKGRSGIACLFVAVVLAGSVGGVSYVGYQFWQDKFGAAPDFEGSGNGSVQVEIQPGATGADIGNALKNAGVVKSVDAFVAAQGANPNGGKIQDGVYTLKKGMSAASAVEMMLRADSRNGFSIPEGQRNVWVYEQIDKRLELKPGTTETIAKEQADSLGLPEWAKGHKNVKDPLEGFLFPATYPVAKGAKPEAILKKMVVRANQEYDKADLEAKAKKVGLDSPWELLTVASLVQAEGKTEVDYRKMAEVVYNRLKPTNTETNQLLQFDSAFNYLKGQSEIDISESEINSNQDPYNTYTQKGLTPGPIGNPGQKALLASTNPTAEGWMYFVATDGEHKTEFAKTHTEFQKLKDKFNEQRGS
ncbi:endolytic transglycosylase MltG [Streptomyces sp. SCSIO 30461]|uniref:endolytic transglycosylase MltG n=1 Tax=Streptomyces sp. SCSIO 30461 TaxID=3118085 RepID=UPI0030CDEE93